MSARSALPLILVALFAVGAIALFHDHLGTSTDRGMHGIELTLPPDAPVIVVGEVPLAAAAARAREELASAAGVFVVEFEEGDLVVQWVIDPSVGTIDERRASRSGTLRRLFWSGDLRRRLDWASDHGHLSTPDLPAGESRNLYH